MNMEIERWQNRIAVIDVVHAGKTKSQWFEARARLQQHGCTEVLEQGRIANELEDVSEALLPKK